MMLDRRSLIVGGCLAALGGFAYAMAPNSVAEAISDTDFRKMLPTRAGLWTAERSAELILPAEDALSAKLYENLETLIYHGSDVPGIMFLIAYSSVQKNDVHAHRPEVCYPAAGFPIIHNQPLRIKLPTRDVDARYLIAARGDDFEHIVYWVRVGNSFPISWQQQRVDMAVANISGVIPDGVLVRASTITDSRRYENTGVRDFLSAISSVLNPIGNRIFFGKVA
jgi:EpsI family protein